VAGKWCYQRPESSFKVKKRVELFLHFHKNF
jgi:hypothetical protein